MKKYVLFLSFFFAVLGMYAQSNPTRLIVAERNGSTKGFLVERLDSLFFEKLEEPVRVEVLIHDVISDNLQNQKIVVSFTRNRACRSFRFSVVPKARADAWKDDAVVADYLERIKETYYTDDFDHGEIAGFEPLTPGGEYTVLAMAYDRYGIACEAARANFVVPELPAEGNPSVAWKLDDVQTQELTLAMTPNEDCASYYICLFKEGEVERKFQMWAPQFGFATIGDMVKSFSGDAIYDSYTKTWTDLVPNTKYEIYIVPCDVEDVAGETVVAKVQTLKMGGSGLAEMTITVGDFGHELGTDGTVRYWQKVTYTPNDQTSAHRDMMLEKSALEDGTWTEESFVTYMKNEKNPDYQDDEFWDVYGVDEAQWNVSPETTYYIYSIAKNADGEWGPLAKGEVITGPSVNSAVRTVTVGQHPRKTVKIKKSSACVPKARRIQLYK